MQSNRSRDTTPELAVRREAHRLGLRYRVCARPLPELRRTADLVFSRAKVAVFVDGCYWHGCPAHHRSPAANRSYWADKVERNRQRDLDTDKQLEDAGWTVIRIWEHEDPATAAALIKAEVTRAAQSRTDVLTADLDSLS
jgi:DNA mismatch endonuclease, patch repair protein